MNLNYMSFIFLLKIIKFFCFSLSFSLSFVLSLIIIIIRPYLCILDCCV